MYEKNIQSGPRFLFFRLYSKITESKFSVINRRKRYETAKNETGTEKWALSLFTAVFTLTGLLSGAAAAMASEVEEVRGAASEITVDEDVFVTTATDMMRMMRLII